MQSKTITDLGHDLEAGRLSASALTATTLERAADPDGEGARVFTRRYTERAQASAQAADTLRAVGLRRSPIDGLPISIKDLFDVAGERTQAGSVVLDDAPVAAANAVIVDRLLAAGAVLVGCTNMTEFAYSGLGINPHFDTPRNPWDRAAGRIPGGSSSGAAVSVSDGMAVAAIGTDTGGSVRIPAALCGLTGFKPTARRVSMQGVLPLSPSLDSIGPIAQSVTCCAILDAILTGEAVDVPAAAALKSLTLAIPTTTVFEGADATVLSTFERAVKTLTQAGVRIQEIALPAFGRLGEMTSNGGFTAAEAWAWHRRLISQSADRYDPRVVSRIRRGEAISAADYIDLLQARRAWIAEVEAAVAPFDALLLPTTPTIAPTIESVVASDEAYGNANMAMLRNPTFINFLDGCALSLPCHTPGDAPVGLMLAAPHGADRRILSTALAVESALAARN